MEPGECHYNLYILILTDGPCRNATHAPRHATNPMAHPSNARRGAVRRHFMSPAHATVLFKVSFITSCERSTKRLFSWTRRLLHQWRAPRLRPPQWTLITMAPPTRLYHRYSSSLRRLKSNCYVHSTTRYAELSTRDEMLVAD